MFDLSNISFGKNLVWFFGVVENRIDPNFLGRVQVRCIGHHTSNRFDLPTEDLPWAMVMQPVTSAAQTDVGESPTGLVDGSWVVGFFLDGEEAQQPFVLGSVGGFAKKPEKLTEDEASDWAEFGFKDVREDDNLQGRGFPFPPVSVRKKEGSKLGVEIDEQNYVEKYPRSQSQNLSTVPKLARGKEDLNIYLNEAESMASTGDRSKKALKEPMLSKYNNENINIQTAKPGINYSQPTLPYNAIYPFNHVRETESGHVIEYDDTPGAERIHEYHRSGTFREVHPDGKLVSQIMNENYNITESNSYEYVKGEKVETYRRGLSTLINAGRFGGEDYDVRVAGSSNYNLTVDEGNFNIKTTTGQIKMITNSLKLEGQNEIIQAATFMELGVGDHVHNIQDTFQATAGGTYSVSGGYVRTNANMNMSIGAGDNIDATAGHTIGIRAENTFAMPMFYTPVPKAVRVEAGHGHIEMNAEDGDTRISARAKLVLFDSATFSVTSSLPTSIASLMQFNPSPAPGIETHMTHPASIIGSTKTGYIYWQNLRPQGDIVSDALGLGGSVRMRSTPTGMIEETGGVILHTATSSNIVNTAAMNFFVFAQQGVYTNSGLGTQINSAQEVFVRSGTITQMTSAGPTSIASITGGVHLGSHGAFEPTLKGPSFLKTFYLHTHLTPMGPTGPVDFITNPQLALWAAESLAKKTMVF